MAIEATPIEKNEATAIKNGVDTNRSIQLEYTKVVLDFLSKFFYPMILTVILYFLWPLISAIDFKSLVSRLQSAKAGEYEFNFSQAQDVGAEIAPLNRKVNDLERQLSLATSEIKKLQTITTTAKPSDQEIKVRQEKTEFLKVNARYTTLVFHRESITSRRRAAEITQAVLTDGYQASDTETDFSELQKVTPRENVVFLVYTEKGGNVLSALEAIIQKNAPNAEIQRNPRATRLKRGDVQIFVF